ncbi:hypothetical protein SERLA73DRAFT_182028 [Serpula lacrymans var. lacrymans S7.3]|uniref:Uncharacterized protein n=2 Tax=Serpula lacrymans var. lacrymans TaxID=341189 RepID=F8PZ55_SERL3|nr:uncharacterized protein SERLADRAFT_468486 [Serpula lacrymans var. lacrymans S7.9]EGN99168.1 hypothetical protein SERLA73DRAFT_182028 [Serpula lacrymans var. lacrymans S7.3]EGO24736.1 hypothetical protein SERLADRAFT_468486 [Serpula lacrymans var. lacrymans S7.9]
MNSNSDIKSRVNYAINQEVEVRIRANVWVVGIIVGILEVAKRCTRSAYRIVYTSEDQQHTAQFEPEDVRPKENTKDSEQRNVPP